MIGWEGHMTKNMSVYSQILSVYPQVIWSVTAGNIVIDIPQASLWVFCHLLLWCSNMHQTFDIGNNTITINTGCLLGLCIHWANTSVTHGALVGRYLFLQILQYECNKQPNWIERVSQRFSFGVYMFYIKVTSYDWYDWYDWYAHWE